MIANSNYSNFIENPSDLCAFIAGRIEKKDIKVGKDGSIEMTINIPEPKKSLKMQFDAVRREISKDDLRMNKLQRKVKALKE